jgi:hypothetical protein
MNSTNYPSGTYAPGIGLEGYLLIEPLQDGTYYLLHRSFTVISLDRTITLPKGFVTDFASTPRFIWSDLPPLGAYDPAVAVHDGGYQFLNKFIVDGPNFECQKDVDLTLFDICDRLPKVSWCDKEQLYWGVRSGGESNWNGYRDGTLIAPMNDPAIIAEIGTLDKIFGNRNIIELK